jgi:hypothetical protein
MSIDTPIRLLEAIVDEVEGLRRTDARSFLPEPLLRRARDVLTPHTAAPGAGGAQLRSPDDLVGHTIAHVFDGSLKHGDLVLVTADGSFLALRAEGDDEEASIETCSSGYGPTARTLASFVYPGDLKRAGLLSESECRQIERQETEQKLAEARRRLESARHQAAAAQAALDRLLPKETADAAPAA